MSWASNLTVSIGATLYDDWRLPVMFDESCGDNLAGEYNCTNSEMGHLYYTELGNTAGFGFYEDSDFEHLSDSIYWSGTEYSSDINNINAWFFYNLYGQQGYSSKVASFYAMAVRPGLIVVPEPISSTLFMVGSAILGFRRFRLETL